MDFEVDLVGDGYLATIRGEITADELRRLWDVIVAQGPDGGFVFGILDIQNAAAPDVRPWPADDATLERLHPIARRINQTLRPGFRMAVVSLDGVVDAVIADLSDLVSFGTPTRLGDPPVGRRFETVDAAMAWCRGEANR